MMPYLVPDAICPCCYARLNGCLSLHGKGRPDPGDLTVCAYCGCALRFNTLLQLERFPPADCLRLRAEDPKAYAVLKREQLLTLVRVAGKEGRATLLAGFQNAENN